METTYLMGIILCAAMTCAAYSDLKIREIPDVIPILLCITGVMCTGIVYALLGGLFTGLPYMLGACLSKGKLGGGDIKLMIGCGMVLGICGGFIQSLTALSLVVLYGVYIRIKKGKETYQQLKVPLAPFLCAGGIFSFIITNF